MGLGAAACSGNSETGTDAGTSANFPDSNSYDDSATARGGQDAANAADGGVSDSGESEETAVGDTAMSDAAMSDATDGGPGGDGASTDGMATEAGCAPPPSQSTNIAVSFPDGYIADIVPDTDQLFFSTFDVAAGTVSKVPLGGGPTTLLAGNQSAPLGLVVDANNVYWVNNATPGATLGQVSKLPKSGGTPITLATAVGPFALALDANNVYWLGENGAATQGIIRVVPIDGGTATVLAGAQVGLGAIAVVDERVYWTTTVTVMSVGVDGGAPETLAAGQLGALGLSVGAGTIYWSNSYGGTIMTMGLDGGAPVTLASGQNSPSTLVLDGSNLYWINRGSSTSGCHNGEVKRLDLGSGTVTTLATGQNFPTAIAVDNSNVYWANSSEELIHSVPK